MPKKFFLTIFLLIISSNLFSSLYKYNNPNNFGTLGVINTPSARFFLAPSGSFSIYHGDPDSRVYVTAYPYDWLEASLFYSSVDTIKYFTQDFKDKGLNLKFKIKEQGNFPALAVGFNDIGGTGLYSGEYIVSSFSRNKMDVNFGIGWGHFNGKNHFENPFSKISERFSSRTSEINNGGKPRIEDFFSGKNVSFFGGIRYILNKDFILKAEYDPIRLDGVIKYTPPEIDLNFGIDYVGFEKYNISLNLERGNIMSLNFSYKDSSLPKEIKYKNNVNLSIDSYENLRKLLQANNIGISEIYEADNGLHVQVTQNSYKDFLDLDYVVDKAIADSNLTEEVVKIYTTAGLKVRTPQSKLKNKKIIYKNKYKGINQSISPKFRPFIASREDFLKFGIFLEHDAELILSENLFISTNLKYSLYDNFDDLFIPPVDTYPNQVRSDIKKYLNNIGNSVSIGRTQLDFFKTLSRNNHILLTAGIYEDMFTGFGFEYLNFESNKRFSWGFEAHQVFKRDYDFGFGLLDYKNTTYHFNTYYKNDFIIPFNTKISFGEYLAGDKGGTIQLSRKFRGGIEFGIFATFTDVGFEKFGEGSFDKGIFFTIPIGKKRDLNSFFWRPLTKDPGQKLLRKNQLYDLVQIYSNY